MIAVRDNDGNEGFALHRVFYPVKAILEKAAHLSLRPCPGKVRSDRPFSGVIGILLAVRIIRSRRRVGPPVIQDLGDADDLFRSLRAAENQIMILRAVELRPEKSGFIEKRTLHDKKMRDVIIRTKEVKVEGRLPVRLEMRLPIVFYLVFVGIQQIRALR